MGWVNPDTDKLGENFSELTLNRNSEKNKPQSTQMNPPEDQHMEDADHGDECKTWNRYTRIPPVPVYDDFGNEYTEEDRKNQLEDGLLPDTGKRVPFDKYQYCEYPRQSGNYFYRLNPRWQAREIRRREDRDAKFVGQNERGGVQAGKGFETRSQLRARIGAIQHPNPPVLFAGTDHEVRPLLMQGVPVTRMPVFADGFTIDQKIGGLEQNSKTHGYFKQLVNDLVKRKQAEFQDENPLAIPGVPSSPNLAQLEYQARKEVAANWNEFANSLNAARAAEAPPADGGDWEQWLRGHVFQQRPESATTAGPPNIENRQVQTLTMAGTHLHGKEFTRAVLWNMDPREMEDFAEKGDAGTEKFSNKFNPAFVRYQKGELEIEQLPSAHAHFGVDPTRTYAAFVAERSGGGPDNNPISLVEKIRQLNEIPGFVELVEERTTVRWEFRLQSLRRDDPDELPDFETDTKEEVAARNRAYGEKRRDTDDGQPGPFVADRSHLNRIRRDVEQGIALQWDLRDSEASLARIRQIDRDSRPVAKRLPIPRSFEEQKAKMIKSRNKGAAPPTDEEVRKALEASYAKDERLVNDASETLRDLAYRGSGRNRALNWQRDVSTGLMRPVDFPSVDGQQAGVYPAWLSYTPWRRRIAAPSDYTEDMTEPEILNEAGLGQVEVVWFATLQSQMNKFRHRNFMDPETSINELRDMSGLSYARQYGDENSIPPVWNTGTLNLLKDAVESRDGLPRESTGFRPSQLGMEGFVQEYEAYLKEVEVYTLQQKAYAAPLAAWQNYRDWHKKTIYAELNYGTVYSEYEEWYLSLPLVKNGNGQNVRAWKSGGVGRGAVPMFVPAKREIIGVPDRSQWTELFDGYRTPPAPEDLADFKIPKDLQDAEPPLPFHDGKPLWDPSNPALFVQAHMPPLGVEPEEPAAVAIPMPKAGMPTHGNSANTDRRPWSVAASLVYELYKLGAFELLDFKRPPAPSARKNDTTLFFGKDDKNTFVLFYALYPAKAVRDARNQDVTEQRKMMDNFEKEFSNAARLEGRRKAAAAVLENAINRELNERDDAIEAAQPARRAALVAEREQKANDLKWQIRKAGRDGALAKADEYGILPSSTQDPDTLWTPYANGVEGAEPPPPPYGDYNPGNPHHGADGERYETEQEWLARKALWDNPAFPMHRKLPWEPRRHEAAYWRYVFASNFQHVEVHRKLPNTADPTLEDDKTDRAPIGARLPEDYKSYEMRTNRWQSAKDAADAQRAANANPNDVRAVETDAERALRVLMEEAQERKKLMEAKKQARREAARAERAAQDARRDEPSEPPVVRDRSRGTGEDVASHADRARIEEASRMVATAAQDTLDAVNFDTVAAFAGLSLDEIGARITSLSNEARATVIAQVRAQGPAMEKAVRLLMAREVVRRVGAF